VSGSDELPVHQQPGPILLLAGPGTGKTTRLAKRIRYLVEDRAIDPDTITVLTFSSAASGEMHARISDSSDAGKVTYIRSALRPSNIRTIHSLGYAIIRAGAKEVGLPEHPTLVAEDSVRDVVMEDAARLAGYSSAEASDTATCRQVADCKEGSAAKCSTCQRYRSILKACGSVDYDELLLLSCRILRENPSVRDQFRQRAMHLLVDEYQDVNAAQREIIHSLSEGVPEGLFVVGDDDQSIYSWRGGTPTYIRTFELDFSCPGATAPLQECYRSAEHIFKGASAVVARFDSGRLDKGEIRYMKELGAKIQVHEVPSDAYEAAGVLRILDEAESRSVLILYPNIRIARGILAELRRRGIPFEGPAPEAGEGLWFLDRLFRWLADPDDSLALRVCIQAMADSGSVGIPSPRVRKAEKRSAREAALASVAELWRPVLEGRGSLWDALRVAGEENETLKTIVDACHELREVFEEGSVEQLLGLASRLLRPWATVKALVNETGDWLTGGRSSAGGGNVRVLSLQKSKGLEADIVCVLAAEEGVLPRDGLSESQLAEQARLFYVAMTRAREALHIFHTRKRDKWTTLGAKAEHGYAPPIRSRFIDAIPSDHVEHLQTWPTKRK
jgi:superfamily I DNA/RNA helicase